MAQQINLKSFQLIVKNTKTYELIVFGFTKTLFWIITLIQNITMTVVASLKLNSTSTISLDPLRLNIGTMFLTSKISSAISNSLILSSVASLIYKVTATISNSVLMEYVLKLTSKISSTLNTTQNIVLVMITAIFNTLGDYDTDTLGTMDVQTLGDLDYTEV